MSSEAIVIYLFGISATNAQIGHIGNKFSSA